MRAELVTKRKEPTTGFARYEQLIADLGRDTLIPLLKESDDPAKWKPIPKAPDLLIRGFSEISESMEIFRLARSLIASRPRSKAFRLDAHVKYHINAYLHEIYILQERLIAHAKRLIRSYKRTTRSELVEQTLKPVIEWVIGTLEGPVNIRGAHVHDTRFNDQDLSNLSAVCLVAEKSVEFEKSKEVMYAHISRKWQALIDKNNDEILTLLDRYFDAMYAAITENGEVVHPEACQVPKSEVTIAAAHE